MSTSFKILVLSAIVSLMFPASGWAQLAGLQQKLQSDLSVCSNKKKQAELCCGDPTQCASGMSPEAQKQLMQLVAMGAVGAMSFMNSGESGINPQGIAALCQMLGALGGAGAGVNSGGAEVCDKERNACSSNCTSLQAYWKQKKDECDASNCAEASFYADALTQFESSVSTCSSLQANSSAMQSQSQATGGAGGMGQFCAQIAGLMQQQEQAQTAAVQTVINCNDPAQYAANLQLCVDCKADPENINCGKVATDNSPKVGFDSGGGLSAADFNTGAGMDGLDQDPQFGNFKPTANQSGTVSGQGGGIPGGGNFGGDFGGDQQQQSGEAGYNTDVLNGTSGGAGYSVAAGSVDASGGFSGYGGPAAMEEEIPYEGMDLKKFLPGGEMDPSRRIAGALVNAGQINGKNENIFERISQRMKAVCNTKRLKDCGARN